MSLLEETPAAARRARQIRLGVIPKPVPATPIPATPIQPPQPLAFDAGWQNMWFDDLVRGPSRPRRIQITEIQEAVCEYYGVDILDLTSHRRRTRDVNHPRQVAIYLCRALTLNSYSQIARRFGDRDHTTIIHAVQKISGLLGDDFLGRDLKLTYDIKALRKVLA